MMPKRSKKLESVADLTFGDMNANRGTERGRAMLEDSLREHGFLEAGTLDKNGRIIGGSNTNTRPEGRRMMKHEKIRRGSYAVIAICLAIAIGVGLSACSEQITSSSDVETMTIEEAHDAGLHVIGATADVEQIIVSGPIAAHAAKGCGPEDCFDEDANCRATGWDGALCFECYKQNGTLVMKFSQCWRAV